MRKKLHAKGWSKEEIDRAEKIMKKAEKNKHPDLIRVENSLFWFTLAIGILGTILLSLLLVPILIINNNAWSYILTAVFGFLLGILIVIIIKDMHWLEHHHHLSITILIPVIALLNFLIVVNRVNLFNLQLGLSNFHNPAVIGMIYLVCFVIPYIIFLYSKR
ncbi:hypothetical protein AYK26_01950 [Euryarchaeota archaeon SM23-78]|nr:MAG: hypothetical protein AYK26_01950 [Euryarchaeota archaeon SM23-78]MBW3000319.1 hypothetical protein [Candidatus Woesearchaeota archaeon]